MTTNDEGPGPLKLYRVYHVAGGGGIEAVSIVEAAENLEAKRLAEERLQTSLGELWLDNEMISAVRRRD